ncbi:histidinol phosphate aminotransferase [Marivita sp. S0852]|uniref:histidinol phosphate aminotransferase n=1 Tax=Marivita sp. S0852 TaxID=3373893 RepID=UPI00398232F9
MDNPHPKRVEDYTTAALFLIFINMLWIFGMIWAKFGLVAVIVTGWAVNFLITRLDHYRASREIKWSRSDA